MKDPDLKDSLLAAQQQPNYSGDPQVDRLYDMVLRLTQELAVTREEVSVLRELLTQKLTPGSKAETTLVESDTFAADQINQHRALVARVLGDLEKD